MLSLFRYLSVTSVTTFGNWDSSSARFARRRTLGKKHGNLYEIPNDSEKHTYSGIFCTSGDALRWFNFAPKNSEAYEL